jgi:predicted ATPase
VPRTEGGNIERKRLVQSLKELELRSHLFSKYGLTLKIKVAPLIRSLKASHRKVLPFAAQVVSSFIEGQRARLDSLEKFNDLLNRFVGLINGFLVDKRIILNVDSGIRILKNSGLALEPEKLSSGEKQLLLLFCSALTVTDRMSLFLIDEPEISLNVKWQRRLIDSLSDITKDSQCQFLLATHSIELLSKHKIHTIKLKPSKIRKEHG